MGIGSAAWVLDESTGTLRPTEANIASVVHHLGDRLAPDVVASVLQQFGNEVTVPQRLLTGPRGERDYVVGRAAQQQAVTERLDLLERLAEPGAARALFTHWEPLSTYLALTCFDLLGQPADWLTYGAWLAAKRTASEVAASLSRAPEAVDPVAAAAALHASYNERYGVRTSFHRFIYEVLHEGSRGRLLGSILRSRSSGRSTPGEHLQPLEQADAVRFLLDIRNGYTHKAQYVVGTPQGTLPEDEQRTLPQFWTQYWGNSTEFWSWYVIDWPEATVSAVKDGLAGWLAEASSS